MKQEFIRKLSAAVAMSLVVGVSLAACGGGSSSTAAGVTKTGSAEGFGGAVTATLTVDANGTVTDCKLEGAQETESIGGAALEELSKQVVAANGPAIDGVAGATVTTNQVDLVYTLDQPLLQPALVLAADVPEPVCFIAPPQHPLAQENTIPLDLLPRQEFLLTERGMSYRDALDQCMAAHGLAIHPYLELGSAALLCQMVEQGMGLSFLPEYIVRSALAEGRLARLNVPDCTVMMHRQLFYHRDKWVTPQMNVFIELVQQQ